MDKPAIPPLTPKAVLGIAAHPDDLDYYAGGTMAAFAKQGADVYYLILTDGGKGTQDRALESGTVRDARRTEQRNAGKILGLKDIFFCDYPDGALENTPVVRRDIVKAIRQVKPDVVVSMDPAVLYSAKQGFINHADHRAAGQAALDAVYPLARDHMSFPELLAEGYEPYTVQTMLLTTFGAEKATFVIDITDTIEQKFQAVGEHVSQSALQDMKAGMFEEATKTGASYHYRYAEPFIRIDIL